MAEEVIKKIIIPKNELPPVFDSNGYYFRYRIVSDDKNRYSHWSEVAYVQNPDVQLVDGSVIINENTATVIWGDEEGRPSYDVFVKFDSQDYIYHGTTNIHTYSFLITGSPTPTTLQVIIQIAGISKTIANNLKIYESGVITI